MFVVFFIIWGRDSQNGTDDSTVLSATFESTFETYVIYVGKKCTF